MEELVGETEEEMRKVIGAITLRLPRVVKGLGWQNANFSLSKTT